MGPSPLVHPSPSSGEIASFLQLREGSSGLRRNEGARVPSAGVRSRRGRPLEPLREDPTVRKSLPVLSVLVTVIGITSLLYAPYESSGSTTSEPAPARSFVEPDPARESIHPLGLAEVSLAELGESGRVLGLDGSLAHVEVIGCGKARMFNTSGTTGYGSAATKEEAAAAALADLSAKLWPSASHTCAECGIPENCKKIIVLLDGGSPEVEFYEILPPPPKPVYHAKATYSGAYAAGCTPCGE